MLSLRLYGKMNGGTTSPSLVITRNTMALTGCLIFIPLGACSGDTTKASGFLYVQHLFILEISVQLPSSAACHFQIHGTIFIADGTQLTPRYCLDDKNRNKQCANLKVWNSDNLTIAPYSFFFQGIRQASPCAENRCQITPKKLPSMSSLRYTFCHC